MIKKNDLILIVIAVLIGLGLIIYFNATKTEGSQVVITVDGNIYDTLPLIEDKTFTVNVDKYVWNTFKIKDGYVDMLEATCPDKLCVNHSRIHYNHETIVCLPNKVVLEIISEEESEIDIIAK